ncbi:hypothetical protein B9L23_10680 [Parageobacillus galactosidasius]|uniref:Uncharacterized protein n=1 Tax=Parageobacillus galactosidasius TaxID=883812 RepID=A0A226QGR7_9BACL|nr:hypothetical protein B9L23_10680 [Parageobacillus galactosidasius]
MIQFHDFGIDVQTYAERGKENDFPLLKKCPHCRAKRPLHANRKELRESIVSFLEHLTQFPEKVLQRIGQIVMSEN